MLIYFLQIEEEGENESFLQQKIWDKDWWKVNYGKHFSFSHAPRADCPPM